MTTDTVDRLTDEQRVRFLCWLARERAPFRVEYAAILDTPVMIATLDDAGRFVTVGIGLTLADAVDNAAIALGWEAPNV